LIIVIKYHYFKAKMDIYTVRSGEFSQVKRIKVACLIIGMLNAAFQILIIIIFIALIAA